MNLFQAQELAIELMTKHNIRQAGWQFKFDNAKRRFGCCNYTHKIISLSAPLTRINDEAHVKDTILHEIAHALAPNQGHNHVWVRKAIEIGCNGKRCYNSKEVATPETKYIAVCHGCGTTHKKSRRVVRKSSCGNCSGGRYNENYLLKYIPNPKY